MDKSSGKTRICVNMIVKDEQDVIVRCLNSVKHLVDAAVLCDTGSTDKTVDVMNQWIKDNDKLGHVGEEPWVDFGHNRTHALNMAYDFIREHLKDEPGTTWYILFMDADDYIIGDDNKPIKVDLSSLTEPAYIIDMKCGTLKYDRTWMIKYNEDKLWKWFEPLHEYVSPIDKVPIKSGKVTGGIMQATRDGARSKDPVKYLKDAIVFERRHVIDEREHAGEKDFEHGDRSIFYLAQCYRDSGRPHLYKIAEKLYIKRSGMGGWPEEVYMSLVNSAQTRIMQDKMDHKVLDRLQKAFELRPVRLEAPYWMLKWYRHHKMFKIGYLFGKTLINTPYPRSDKLFVDDGIHQWKFRDEVAICGYYAGDKKLSKSLWDVILKRNDLGGNRDRIVKNRQFCLTPEEAKAESQS